MNGINDNNDFKSVKKALETLDFSDAEQKDIFKIISAILNLGNITFMDEEGISNILKPELVENVSKVSNKLLEKNFVKVFFSLIKNLHFSIQFNIPKDSK